MAKKAKAERSNTEPTANIAFVGKDKDGKQDLSQAPGKINDGMDTIQLPAPELQAKPFYHEHAARIIEVLPRLYKRFTAKDGQPVEQPVDPDPAAE